MPESKFFNTTKPVSGSIGKASMQKGVVAKYGLKVVLVLVMLLLLAGGALAAVYYYAARPLLSLVSNVTTIKEDIAAIKETALKRDLVALPKLFDKTEADLKTLQSSRDQKAGWAKDFAYTKDYYTDSDYFIATGLILLDAGREAIKLAEPFADAGGFKVSDSLPAGNSGFAEAFAQWIGLMPEIATQSDKLLNYLTLAGQELQKVDAQKYPEEFRGTPLRGPIISAQKTLSAVNQNAQDIKVGLTVFPRLLAVGAPEKRYMIWFQNDKEMRPTGGFLTYISTFRLRNGLLNSDFSSNSSYNIDFTLEVIDPYYTFPKVPAAYNTHLKVERLFARDANISPDLPTAVDQFMLFWDLARPLNSEFKPVDGVITIDTTVLEELLKITGPVTLNGVTFDASTVTLELENITSLPSREQADRKKVLGDLMEAMLKNVFESEKGLWSKLIDKGVELAYQKHITANVFDPEAQLLLEKYNLAGRIVDPVVGDYAFLVSTNLGGGKTNGWFVNKDVTHTVALENGLYVRTVTAKFVYGDRDPQYASFKTRYQDWVRLYVPKGSKLLEVTGSDDPTGEGEERNKTYFHGYVTLAPGETKEITFKYTLPDGLIKDGKYNLYLQKQAGIVSEKHNVTAFGKTQTVTLLTDQKLELSQ